MSIAPGATVEYEIEIPCFLRNNAVPFANIGKISVNITFKPDNSATPDAASFVLSEIFMYFYDLDKSKLEEVRSLPNISVNYLQVSQQTYNIDTVSANAPYFIRLTQNGVTPFIFFYVQQKSDSDSSTTTFQNFIPVTNYEIVGMNNQSVMNNYIMTPFANLKMQQKHFADRYHLMQSASPYYNQFYLFNFCISPKLAWSGEFHGGKLLTSDDYQLKLTFGSNLSNIAVTVFMFKYQVAKIDRRSD